jgi:hypothetical protein
LVTVSRFNHGIRIYKSGSEVAHGSA